VSLDYFADVMTFNTNKELMIEGKDEKPSMGQNNNLYYLYYYFYT